MREWCENGFQQIATQYVGRVFISTVFLGMDHYFSSSDSLRDDPVIWETMAFWPNGNTRQTRCRGNRDDALQMHNEMVAEVERPHWWLRFKKWARKIVVDATIQSR